MICNIITYGKQRILTIYHHGFDDEVQERKLKVVEKIGAYNLVFTESIVPDDEIERIFDWSFIEEGFLIAGHAENPYSKGACAYMTRYGYMNKPSKLFKISGDRYSSRIALDNLRYINAFVKKYTGIDIENNPMLYGDILVYRCLYFNYYANEESIVIETLPAGSIVIVRFKKGEVVVSTKMINVDYEVDKVEFDSEKKWDGFDVEIYLNNELIYFRENIVYMGEMQLNVQNDNPTKTVKLDTISDSYSFKPKGGGYSIKVGTPLNECEDVLNKSSYEIKNRLNNEKTDKQIMFMKPNEIEKALKIIGDVMEKAYDQIWVFDSYFTDKQSVNEMIDWIRILANCHARSKNIVFYCKDKRNALDLNELRSEFENDAELNNILRVKGSLGIRFYQTKFPIHDRFVIAKSCETYFGVALGTSFKSLDKHHYCIVKLNHKISETILLELKSWMLDESNISSNKEI